jgi:hypothetical protein
MSLFIWLMHWPVTLNNQLGLGTIEVCDVIAKLMLTSEFESEQPAIPNQFPKERFSGSLCLSEFAGKLLQTGKLISSPVLSGLPQGRAFQFRLQLRQAQHEPTHTSSSTAIGVTID